MGDRGALVLDDAYLWTTDGNAEASILDGDNEVLETTGALVCSECQVGTSRNECPERSSLGCEEPPEHQDC